ncbi:hypothetical protein [Hyphomicrobium sp.]|uniref:hypothetical protein n=1 Tax=Hyphomicrobium sp. TaxID=82 RepID=UPI0025BA27D9|nr:hypothetical protein [Hyphomicrobium sp.]MCC7254257.1 hypothetical protein [Hyphomicrobium sp.]
MCVEPREFPGSGPIVPLHDGSAPATSGYPFAPVNPVGNAYDPERTHPPAGDAERRFHIVAGQSLIEQPIRLRARTLIFDNPTGQWYYITAAGQYCPPYQYNVPFRLQPTSSANIIAQTPPAYTSAPLANEVATARYLDIDLPIAPLPFDDALAIPAYESGRYYVPMGAQSTAAISLNNRMLLSPFVVGTIGGKRFDRAAVDVTVVGDAGSLLTLGVYENRKGGMYPTTLRRDWGSVPGDAVAVQSITIDEFLPRGIYWLAVLVTNAPAVRPTIRIISGSITSTYALQAGAGALPWNAGQIGAQDGIVALPSTYTASTTGTSFTPTVYMRAA